MNTVNYDVSLLTTDDLFLFNEGSHFQLYRKLGLTVSILTEEQARTLRSGRPMPNKYLLSATSTVGTPTAMCSGLPRPRAYGKASFLA